MMTPQKFSPWIEALAATGIAALCVGAAGWLGWMIGWPDTFDLNSPDVVNPLSLMILGLLGMAAWFAVKALRHEMRHRAFGNAALEIDPPGHLRLGRPFGGRLKSQRPVTATGPFRLVLTCVDAHEVEADGRFKTVHFPVWTSEQTVPAETDVTAGLPFRFDLPASVGPDPVPSGILRGSVNRHRMTVHVPGMRQVVAGNTPPVGRFWTLVARAPKQGIGFRAEIVIPAEAPQRRGRLP